MFSRGRGTFALVVDFRDVASRWTQVGVRGGRTRRWERRCPLAWAALSNGHEWRRLRPRRQLLLPSHGRVAVADSSARRAVPGCAPAPGPRNSTPEPSARMQWRPNASPPPAPRAGPTRTRGNERRPHRTRAAVARHAVSIGQAHRCQQPGQTAVAAGSVTACVLSRRRQPAAMAEAILPSPQHLATGWRPIKSMSTSFARCSARSPSR